MGSILVNTGDIQYYSKTPAPEHATGDIWRGLPSTGLCKRPTCTGVVISPACDLANCKSEVVTYLPVVSIAEYYSSAASYMEYRPALNSCLKEAGMDRFSDYVGLERVPTPQDIDVLFAQVEAGNIKNKIHETRVVKGLQCLKRALELDVKQNDWNDLKVFFGSRKFEETLAGVITNSQRPDLHFLPADKEDPEWSAIPFHSVALLRYPITIPIEILNDASRASSQAALEKNLPVKILRLREAFTGDLTSRFAALFARVGSPDFTPSNIETIKREVFA